MTLQEALDWCFKKAGENLKPFKASFDYHLQERTYRCWGCDGCFISSWPNWIEPTNETFGHKPNCEYISALNLCSKN